MTALISSTQYGIGYKNVILFRLKMTTFVKIIIFLNSLLLFGCIEDMDLGYLGNTAMFTNVLNFFHRGKGANRPVSLKI